MNNPFLYLAVCFLSLLSINLCHAQNVPLVEPRYVCPPCPHIHSLFEGETYSKPGTCPICKMELIEKPQKREQHTTLKAGSGSFYFLTAKSLEIPVFYYKAKEFSPQSDILIVIPGAGRNAWEYRNSWREIAEKHNLLVLSPHYPAENYGFSEYHFAGLTEEIQMSNAETQSHNGRINKYRVKDENIQWGKPTEPNSWIFNDFDQLFNYTKTITHSTQTAYDIFGHSAGGQILHRMAIFNPSSKAKRIIAANSGSYTLVDSPLNMPLGLQNSPVNPQNLKASFNKQLTLLIGENDNDKEQRGTMLHTPTLDQQGLGRLSRGRYFFNNARNFADRNNLGFQWTLSVVPNTGHDYVKMSHAAANILYGK